MSSTIISPRAAAQLAQRSSSPNLPSGVLTSLSTSPDASKIPDAKNSPTASNAAGPLKSDD
jgi:hypothetical protein